MGVETLRRGASARQRVMEAIRRRFRDYGAAPSLRELALDSAVRIGDLSPLLNELARDGLIRRHRGLARGIELPRRGEALSDVELEIEARERGGRLVWEEGPLPALRAAVMMDTDFGMPFGDLLAQMDRAEEAAHGGTGAEAGDQPGRS